MLRVPTSRKRKKPDEKLNLIPIMDSIFIFIFFLLMSATFLKIYEVGSDLPIISENIPPKDEKNPLALTLRIEDKKIILLSGVPSKEIEEFPRESSGSFNLEALHQKLILLKKSHLDEDSIIFEPTGDLTYEEIIKIMDTVRKLNKTDEALYRKGPDGLDVQLKELFSKIIFSNLMN